MPLKKSQLKELTTIYIPSPLEQIQDNQLKMCDKLKNIEEVQGRIRDWKHKHQEDLPTVVGFLKTTYDKISELKTLIEGREWRKNK
jgi:hypothetical protein